MSLQVRVLLEVGDSGPDADNYVRLDRVETIMAASDVLEGSATGLAHLADVALDRMLDELRDQGHEKMAQMADTLAAAEEA